MAKRVLDVVLAALALVATAPLLALAAAGVRLTSPGPVLFRAARSGRGGRTFTMLKFRTMHVRPRAAGPAITARNDARVFGFGALLRRTKVDELPQLWNVLRGDMAVVGPRPEDPGIVAAHYDALGWETLTVRPGLASPGSIYNYTHGERLLDADDPERHYVERLLPVKLALDAVYVRHASVAYDFAVIGRTLAVIAAQVAGRREFPDPPEMAAARALVAAARPAARFAPADARPA